MQYPGARLCLCLMSGAGSSVLTLWAVLIMLFGGQVAAGFAILGGMIVVGLLRALWISRHGCRRMLGPSIAFAVPPAIVLLWVAAAVLLGA
jgi:hypothetical protein